MFDKATPLVSCLAAFVVCSISSLGVETFEYREKLAEQGDAHSQWYLGMLYYNGIEVPQDREQAVKWYTAAAEQGNYSAQFNLGKMYYKGEVVPQDYKQAAKWYRKAAEQGKAADQQYLGEMYEYGKGVPQDIAQAHMWYNIAAANGDELAKKFRINLARKMTSDQIAEAQRMAREMVEANPKLLGD